jgi:hypothetical protein
LHPPPAPLEEVIDAALARVQNMIFLKRAGLDANLDESFLFNLPSQADLLELAIRNIIRFLSYEACFIFLLPKRISLICVSLPSAYQLPMT